MTGLRRVTEEVALECGRDDRHDREAEMKRTAKRTKKITKLDGKTVQAIIDDLEMALSSVAEKWGLSLVRKGCTYRDDEMPVPFRLSVSSDEATSRAERDFSSMAIAIGLQAADFGREFSYAGQQYQICGVKPRSPKYPVLARNVATGKTHKFPASLVADALRGASVGDPRIAPPSSPSGKTAGAFLRGRVRMEEMRDRIAAVVWKDEGDAGPVWLRCDGKLQNYIDSDTPCITGGGFYPEWYTLAEAKRLADYLGVPLDPC